MKFILSVIPPYAINPKYLSGGSVLQRHISTGVQEYQTNASMYPVTKPVSKLEALPQTSGKVLEEQVEMLEHNCFFVGELEFIADMIELPGQLFACFVRAEATPLSNITAVDTSEALVRKSKATSQSSRI